MKSSVYKKDTFLLPHSMGVLREVNIFFSLYVYMKFLEFIVKNLYMTRFFPGAIDKGFGDEIGLCIRDRKGFQALRMLYELISVCITLLI